MVYSTRRFALCLALCYFVFEFFSSCSIAITSPGEERANPIAFCTFVRFALVLFCLFPLPLGVWEGLLFVIVDLWTFLLPFFSCMVVNYILKRLTLRAMKTLTKQQTAEMSNFLGQTS